MSKPPLNDPETYPVIVFVETSQMLIWLCPFIISAVELSGVTAILDGNEKGKLPTDTAPVSIPALGVAIRTWFDPQEPI